jgi:hypothetical protein
VSVKNRKLCHGCEGSVHIHAIKCPYCGTDLAGSMAVVEEAPPPAYALHCVEKQEAPPPAYVARVIEEEEIVPPVQMAREAERVAPSTAVNPKTVLTPMFLIVPGAFFLLFGMMLLLFSHDGVLTLRWNANYWFLYLGLALPLLYSGWRLLNREAQGEEREPQQLQPQEREKERPTVKFGPSDERYRQ